MHSCLAEFRSHDDNLGSRFTEQYHNVSDFSRLTVLLLRVHQTSGSGAESSLRPRIFHSHDECDEILLLSLPATPQVSASGKRLGLIRSALVPEETRGLTRSGDLSRMLPAEAHLMAAGWPSRTVREVGPP